MVPRGGELALAGLSLEVPAGSALGVVGPNGAGKSTLIRLLLGYLRPTRGTVEIGGLPPRGYVERRGVGYVPERVLIPPRWTVFGALRYYAALGRVPDAEQRVTDALANLGLHEVAGRRIAALSKGNLQRVALAQALLGDRQLLVLDEPTDGLDPEWTARARELLFRWRRDRPGRVLVFASHNLDEVERVADSVAVLRDGRLREMLELRAPAAAAAHLAFRIELAGGDDAGAAARIGHCFPGAAPADSAPGSPPAFRVIAPDLPEMNRRLAALLATGVLISSVTPEHESLEERFRRSLGDDE